MHKKSKQPRRVTSHKEETKRNLKIIFDRNQLIRKKMNIDQFGRYKGGLPRNVPDSIYGNRGSSANSTG